MADSHTNGVFDPAAFLKKVEKWPKASTEELFKDAPVDLKQLGITPEVTKGIEDGKTWMKLSLNKGDGTVGGIEAMTPDFDPKGLEISSTGVDASLRKQGIGRAAYEQLIQAAKAEGKTSLYSDYLRTDDANGVWDSLAKRYNVTKIDSAGGPRFKLDITTPRHTPLDAVLSDAKNAKMLQTLTKAGFISSTLSGGLLVGRLLGPIAEAAMGAGGATGGVTLMKYIANNPKTWAMLRGAGRTAETVGRVAGKAESAVSKVVPKATGAEVGTRNKQNMMTDLASSLGGGRD
jgi:predicted GNAT family acetyltransferase